MGKRVRVAGQRLRKLNEKIRNVHLPDEAGLKTIILIKGVKAGILVVLGLGALYLADRDLKQLAEWIGDRFGALLNLDIRRGAAERAISALGRVTPGQINAVAIGALVFAAWNTFEAVGLHYRKEWVAWCSIGLGTLFAIWEGSHVVRHPTIATVIMFTANCWIVWYLFQKTRHHELDKRFRVDVRRLLERHRPPAAASAGSPDDGGAALSAR